MVGVVVDCAEIEDVGLNDEPNVAEAVSDAVMEGLIVADGDGSRQEVRITAPAAPAAEATPPTYVTELASDAMLVFKKDEPPPPPLGS